jgi:hypothetical protein
VKRLSITALTVFITGAAALVLLPGTANASCAGAGRLPFEEVHAGQTLHVSGRLPLACRDTGGPYPAAKAPPRFAVTLSLLPGFKDERTIGHVRSTGVLHPRGVVPEAKFDGTVHLPGHLAPGNYSLQVYGSYERRLRVTEAAPAAAPGPPQLPPTGGPSVLVLVVLGAGLVAGGTLLIRGPRSVEVS